MTNSNRKQKNKLCLDSKSSFGKIVVIKVDDHAGFALIPKVLSAKSPRRNSKQSACFALIPKVLSAKFSTRA